MTNDPDRPILGIAMMTAFCVLAPLGDSLAKLLGGVVPLAALLFARFVVQGAVLAPFALRGGWPRGRLMGLILVRTLLHIAGIGLMFLSLRYLPLADAVAIAFVMPFVMLLLGRLVLGEEVGPYRLGACAVGFAGILLVVQPNFAEAGAPALLPLGVAVVFAFFMMVTRQVSRRIGAVRLQAISGLQASVLLLPAMVWSAPDWPAARELWLLLALGLVGTVAHLAMTGALRHAPASTLAPMQYLEIPFATLIGWVIFADLPNGLALAGIAVTMTAGLAVIARERAIAVRPVRAVPPT